MKLSEVLKEWRWAKKLSVRDVALMIGTSPATLSRIERGEDCDGKTLSKIIRWLLAEDLENLPTDLGEAFERMVQDSERDLAKQGGSVK